MAKDAVNQRRPVRPNRLDVVLIRKSYMLSDRLEDDSRRNLPSDSIGETISNLNQVGVQTVLVELGSIWRRCANHHSVCVNLYAIRQWTVHKRPRQWSLTIGCLERQFNRNSTLQFDTGAQNLRRWINNPHVINLTRVAPSGISGKHSETLTLSRNDIAAGCQEHIRVQRLITHNSECHAVGRAVRHT